MKTHLQNLMYLLVVMSLALAWVPAKAHAQAEADEQVESVDEAAPAEVGEVEQAVDEVVDGPAVALVERVAWVEVAGEILDGPPAFMWDDTAAERSLRSILGKLERVAEDSRYVGLVLYIDQPVISLSHIGEISAGVAQVRAAGKHVFAFAEAYDLQGYLLACSADEIILQEKGVIEITGLGVEEMYLAGTLEKIGLKADFVQVGEFKGADEALTRLEPSEAWNENIDALLDDMYAQIVTRIGDARLLEPAEVERAMGDSWTLTDRQLLRRGLIDRISDRDLVDVTGDQFGDGFAWDKMEGPQQRQVAPDNPFAVFRMLFAEQGSRIRRPTIALVYANGPITSGESSYGGGLLGSESIGSRTLVRTLGKLQENNLVKAVVLRVDSPGGSALASEVIWQAVRELGEDKPVYVSIGPMAASGGYYIASAAHQVYVTDSTIVGSIGVVAGKIVMGGLYEWAGVRVHRRHRGPMGDMFNSVEPFTNEQREHLTRAIAKTYEQFTDRVRIGRGRRVGEMEDVAQGRLFTGRQAVANGLADRVGGVALAIEDAAKQVGLAAGRYDVVELPPPLSFPELLEQMFELNGSHVPAVRGEWAALARGALGPDGWRQLNAMLTGAMQLRTEHTLTLMPAVLIVR